MQAAARVDFKLFQLFTRVVQAAVEIQTRMVEQILVAAAVVEQAQVDSAQVKMVVRA